MAACPYGPHRLTLTPDLGCRRCGGDLRLYAALRDLPVLRYNRARRLWDEGELDAAASWLRAALELREELAEAHHLLAAVEIRRGRSDEAGKHLRRAHELGAEVELEAPPAS
jgi:tetratricopeptide (TPR) repeat protein